MWSMDAGGDGSGVILGMALGRGREQGGLRRGKEGIRMMLGDGIVEALVEGAVTLGLVASVGVCVVLLVELVRWWRRDRDP